MIRMPFRRLESLGDACELLQMAIEIELSTLPPYLYALYSIIPGSNAAARSRLKSVAMQEMAHLCLAANILNALGTAPVLRVLDYPSAPPLIRGKKNEPLILHLLPFSKEAMAQAMEIEEPEKPIEVRTLLVAEGPSFMTIGEFYRYLDEFLSKLPPEQWISGRNQIDDKQFLQGMIFAVNGYDDAHKAIQQIVSEGEGTSISPLDFEGEVAHYYRFAELFHDRVLMKADNVGGYVWGEALGVEWQSVYPAIEDPSAYDFSKETPPVQAAQHRCDVVFSSVIEELQRALQGERGRMGTAVRAMFDLRMAAQVALTVPLLSGSKVAGAAFRTATNTNEKPEVH